MRPGEIRRWDKPGSFFLVVEVNGTGVEGKATILEDGALCTYWLSALEKYTLPLQGDVDETR
jgi:hypothetical protein